MDTRKPLIVDSPMGRRAIDANGSPVGVVRMDVDRSYAGVGKLLKACIDRSDPEAWDRITKKIDYTFLNLDIALCRLESETGFSHEIASRLESGRKLLFKPNLVYVHNIDPVTHGPGSGYTACTEWPFVAALMRWFHDRLGIGYHQMALGEAATVIPSAAAQYTMLRPEGRPVTPEAVIEGRTDDFYGGWGFYFVRKYLADSLDPSRDDDPMKGYEESAAGTYIPPGHAPDRLMVYDLNRIFDDAGKGREVEAPGGVNFNSIWLHKVIVGGDPKDPEDLKAYPGCVLVNVPKLKVHSISLFTNAVKNLGIGLYPMQSCVHRGSEWDYGRPHGAVPGIKFIPHYIRQPDMDFETGLPKRDARGNYIVKKTGGLLATIADMYKALNSQSVFMLHVVDSIEATNIDHVASGTGKKESEGLVFAGLDPVATDLLCARYLFKNTPLAESLNLEETDAPGAGFLQRVPIAFPKDGQIFTRTGYDSPLERDVSFQYFKEAGLGDTRYYATGRDVVDESDLVSLKGHLGRLKNGVFSDMVTKNLYVDAIKFPWDMQKTALSYLESVDMVTGSFLKGAFLKAFDEDGDGVVCYEEYGKQGAAGARLFHVSVSSSITGTEQTGFLRGPFTLGAWRLKWSNAEWNAEGHDLFEETVYANVCWTAFRMSQSAVEAQDPFVPGLFWGRGKWPSFQLARHISLGSALYGGGFPRKASFPGLYSLAFRYADLTQNRGAYAGTTPGRPDPEAIDNYISSVSTGKAGPLDFTFYVPEGYDRLNGSELPNVEATADPALIFAARFAGGDEVWPHDSAR